MKSFFSILLLIFSLNFLKAQNNDSIYTVVQQMPTFFTNVGAYIYDNMKFPDIKVDSEAINTSAFVSFIVEKDGSVSSVKIIRPSMPAVDSAVVRCVKKMPKWQPGMQNNKPVRVMFKVPLIIDVR